MNQDPQIAEKDKAIRYLETAVAVRDRFIYAYLAKIAELKKQLAKFGER